MEMLLVVSLAGVAIPADAMTGTVGAAKAPASISYLSDGHDPAPPAGCAPDSPDSTCQPGDAPLPLPLPVGSQGVPPGVEVYCPGLPWIRHRCHQCLGDPSHQCWDR